MNLQTQPVLPPLRVLVVNPLSTAAHLAIAKILSGDVFGARQHIDLTLLVYSNEEPAATELKLELYCCSFPCMNLIKISSDLPTILDADVFCFITNFKNPNYFNVNEVDHNQFDAMYLVIKLAYGLSRPLPKPEDVAVKKSSKAKYGETLPRKPIFMADGIVALEILKQFSLNVPSDQMFCPSPLPAIAKSLLGDHLKVQCNVINNVLVWGANDEVFHIDVEPPLIIRHKVKKEDHCDWNMIDKELQISFNLDHTEFNESWMKKDLIYKAEVLASKNPHGDIYRASAFTQALQTVWNARAFGDKVKVYASMGVISNGSLETMKGSPYILPLVFSGDSWTVNKMFEETSHLQQEIKRINRAVKEYNYDLLIPYCKKFLQDNVINQAFIHADDESESLSSFQVPSSRHSAAH